MYPISDDDKMHRFMKTLLKQFSNYQKTFLVKAFEPRAD